MARPTSCVLDSARAGDPTLALLLSVLQSIQAVTKTLEQDVQIDNAEERTHLSLLRIVAFSTWEIISPLAAAGLDAELTNYTESVLDAVERAFDVRCNDDDFDCPIWKKSLHKLYPKCHALCHLATTRGVFSFCDTLAQRNLLGKLAETFNALESRCSDHSEPIIPTKKRPRASQWAISSSMSQAFHAISKCRNALSDCSVRGQLEARLALATYWNIEDDGYHTVDMLFALGHQTPQWDEVRIHMNSDAKKARRKSTVRFADTGGKAPPAASYYPWRKAVPVQVSHFCSLLDTRRARINARMAINLTLGTGNGMLDHNRTKRVAKSTELSHSLSLADILTSHAGNLCQMAKLLLSSILGYSLFYLYEGPWLLGEGNSIEWSHDRIMFFAKGGRVLLRPYIRYKLGHDPNHDKNGEQHQTESSIHPYPAMVSFAITLLEIHLGKSLESHLGIEPLMTDDDKWACAQEVFEEQKEFIPWPNYRNAIEACLDPSFADNETNPDYGSDAGDDGCDDTVRLKHLRTLIYQTIVCPLYDELDRAFGEFINHHDIDKHAAEMDLFHGSAVTDNHPQNATIVAQKTRNEKLALYADQSTYINASAKLNTVVKVTPILSAISREMQSPPTALDIPKHAVTTAAGEIYTVFGDSNASSPGEGSLTDGWFTRFGVLSALEPLKELEPGNPQRIRMAIIDTGIDMGHPDIRAAEESGLIIKVCDFVDGRNGVQNMNAGDACGHGTHIASIILGMAPNVDLYIARVTAGPKMSDSQAENIAKAIHTAVSTWNCSIINLSLGFDCTIPSIDSELQRALDANVLVFAAASNEGGNRGITYPAWCPRVFCIHSTDSYGNPSKFSPTPDDHNSSGDRFGVLGESISGVWPTPAIDDLRWPRRSGTSFAAPVAASLAACLLSVESQWEMQTAVKLASYDGMRRVFKAMANPRGGYEYLNPFSFLDREQPDIMSDLQLALNPRRK